MKITQLETFFVKPRWMFLKVSTDEGLVGWGEPIVEGRARTVAMAIEELHPLLIGQDPRRIEHLWQQMYRGTFYRGGPILVSAISGIEQALWDIKGKALNVPVYDLLGGSCRTRIRMYTHCGGASPQDATMQAKGLRVKGYTAVKTGIDGPVRAIDSMEFIDKTVTRIAAIRQELGRGVDLAVDFHGRLSPAMSKRLIPLLEPFQPMFIEEPCLPENVPALAAITASTTIPIATGERLFTRWGFREVLERQAAAVLQPDVCHAGGIFETRKIAAMAETYYVSIAPHNPLGPISLAACLQVDACTPNFLVQEHPGLSNRWDLGHGFLKTPFNIQEGYIETPQGPGLGIDVNEDAVRERAYPGDWDTPRLLQTDDHSVADW
ncbi:MAG: galactonate dehydratase [Lentisphaerae bacterium]|nr:galactonate dehydratase [Lentisphaerota bacterium]